MQGTLGDDRNPVRRGRPLCSNTEDKDHAQAAANSFAADDGTMWPRRPPRSPTTSLNVDGQVLSTRGELGYVVTDVNGELPSSLPAMLRGLHETGRLLTFPSPMRATPGDGSERGGTRSVSVLDDAPL
jgi:hypothetical protein